MPMVAVIAESISIHASRGGSDRPEHYATWAGFIFQSTLPAGEATFWTGVAPACRIISIHASRGGSDFVSVIPAVDVVFQSTLPAGEATFAGIDKVSFDDISIHASRGGSDGRVAVLVKAVCISIHASRGGSDIT